MTVMELLRGTGTGASNRGAVDPARVRRAVLSGAGAAAVGACVFILPALMVWVAASESTVSWTSALGTGAALWLLGGGAHVTVGALPVTVVPLLFLGLLVWLGGRAAARATAEAAGDRTVVHVRGLVHGRLAAELGGWVGGYAACALVWVLLAYAAGPDPVRWTVVVPVLVVPVAAAGLALRRHVARRPELLGEAAVRPSWLPEAVRRGVRPGLEGAATLLAIGVALVVLMVVLHFGAVKNLQSELAPGLVGGVVLALAQLTVLPNLGLWAVSFLAGSGFSAVEGASATWTGARSSVLPMVPVFGALPEPGAFPGVMPAVVLVPVAVGAFVGWRSLRSVARLSTTRTKLTVTAVAVVVTALTIGLLDALGGGSLGAGRLADIGAPALAMTAALFVELAIGAALVLGWDRWKLRR
jgi:hypothetical protein